MATLKVSYTRTGDVHTIGTGNKALGDLVIDNSSVPAEERGGTAKQLLGASALFCYCAALVAALDARGSTYSDIRAEAEVETGTNDKSQGRVKKITIRAWITLPEEDEDIFERCEKIMSRGCLVTGSMHEGIEMVYDLQPVYED